jgi:molybdopterin molybdotransferase
VQRLVVSRRPKLHLLVTGSELVPRGAPPEPGRIHDSNSLMVRLLAANAGARVVEHDLVADDPMAITKAINDGLAGDVLVVCGGVSVGAHDHVRAAFRHAGVTERFWRVAMKPGKPMWFGTHGRTLVFGLPGNPLPAIVCTAVFVVPALRRLQGVRTAGPMLEIAKLADAVELSPRLTTFVMSRFEDRRDGTLKACPMSRQGSHMAGSFCQSDGFAVVPPGDAPLPTGSAVGALRLTDRSLCWDGTEWEATARGNSIEHPQEL